MSLVLLFGILFLEKYVRYEGILMDSDFDENWYVKSFFHKSRSGVEQLFDTYNVSWFS